MAKQEKNRNESRIRYLERMIRTAKVIAPQSRGEGVVGLFDQVTVYNEKLGREMTFRIVTTLRQDTGKGLISKESPVGRALLGKKVGGPGLGSGQRRSPVLYGNSGRGEGGGRPRPWPSAPTEEDKSCVS